MKTVLNKDGSADITIYMAEYTQGSNVASGYMIFMKKMDPVNITGITNANPAVVTAVAHGLTDVKYYRITGVVGMTEVNDADYKINVINANSFSLDAVDSTGWGTYTSGGIVSPGPLSTEDIGRKIALQSRSYTFEGVPADMSYRFGMTTYKQIAGISTPHSIVDLSTWRMVRPATTPNFTGNISGEAAADIQNKVKGMNTSGDVVGKGAGNQRIYIDYDNGELIFYDDSDTILVKIGAGVWGNLLGVKMLGPSVFYMDGSIADTVIEDGKITFGKFNPVMGKRSGIQMKYVYPNSYFTLDVVDEDSLGYDTLRLGGSAIVDIRNTMKFKGTTAFNSNGEQESGIKTIDSFCYGYNPAISSSGTYEMKTADGSQNGQGYRMLGTGKVIGLSVQLDVITAFDTGDIDFLIYKNGVQSTEFTVNIASTSTGDDGGIDLTGDLSFITGDRLTVKAVASAMTVGKVENISAIIKVVS